ncbi:Hus1-like protein [Ascobolus immersus RN42]|uniref:Checkpoint protein n=1 Tax=Ascobolus immersus RN42 TaxID=1160509 RepID=A0A3N4HNU9_ASCIM|nr:Hus1-like protein [Ascobolus immersus RN42]
MRFKTSIQNISSFTKLIQSLLSVGNVAWMRLSEDGIQFTIVPELGVQVWTAIHSGFLFDQFIVESVADNVINLDLPLDTLYKALKSCNPSSQAVLRLTKRAGIPILSLTVATSSSKDTYSTHSLVITQEIPIKVLAPRTLESITEPEVPEPDVNILLPPLAQLRAFSDRFANITRIEGGGRWFCSANHEGEFKIKVQTDSVMVESCWKGLAHPEGDLGTRPGMARREFTTVSVDGKDWIRLMKASMVGKRVLASFCEGHALKVYVYMTDIDEEYAATMTYYMSAVSA